MGSAITAITFPYVLTDKERYTVFFDWQRKIYTNPLDYFGMGIIEEIRFFSFDMDDPARNQKLCAEMMRKIEKQGVWIVKKKCLKYTEGIHRKI